MIEDKTVPYEILIRFDTNGALQGAHVCHRRIVTVDGETMKDEILQARPFDLNDATESEVLGQALSEAVASNQALQTALENASTVEVELNERIAGLEAALTAAHNTIADLEATNTPEPG